MKVAWKFTVLCVLTITCCVAGETLNDEADIAKECSSTSVTRSNGQRDFCKGDLIFEDTFDDLDLSKWKHVVTMHGGGNGEFQVYWPDETNSFVQDGHLRIHPGKLADVYGEDFLSSGTIDLGENCTSNWLNGCKRTGDPTHLLPPATSARLASEKSFSFVYGNVEIRAKLPAGDWLWPALWMMPQESVYGGWPSSGEIDVLESRGNLHLESGDGTNIGAEQASSAMHWGPKPSLNSFGKTFWKRQSAPGVGYNNDFHLYQLEWTPDYIKFSIDDTELGKVTPPDGGFWELGKYNTSGLPNPWINGTKMAPFDQEFHLIMNVAVGGTNGYFTDGGQNPGGKPWSNQSPQAFKDFWDGRGQWEQTWEKDGSTDLVVDYVRVWAL